MRREDGPAAVRILRRLLAAQRRGEAAVELCIAGELAECGATVNRLDYRPRELDDAAEFAAASVCADAPRRVLSGRLPGRADRPSLLLFAHPDCEPVAGLERWRRDPFAGEARDGRLYGFGVADDLAGCAVGLAILRQLATAPERGDLVFAAAPSKGYARGAAALFDAVPRPDAALYLHPAESGRGLAEIKTATPGQLEFRIHLAGQPPATTEPAHTALARPCDNPVERVPAILTGLRAWAERRAGRLRHAGIEAVAGRATNLLVSHLSVAGTASLSRVPGSCTLAGAVSLPPGEPLQEVRASLDRAVRQVAAAEGWSEGQGPRLDWVSGASPGELPADHPLLLLAGRSVAAVAGVTPRPHVVHVASDIRHPLTRGIPCIGMGCRCGNLVQNGAVDEWIDLPSFKEWVAAAGRIAEAWISGRADA